MHFKHCKQKREEKFLFFKKTLSKDDVICKIEHVLETLNE